MSIIQLPENRTSSIKTDERLLVGLEKLGPEDHICKEYRALDLTKVSYPLFGGGGGATGGLVVNVPATRSARPGFESLHKMV